MNVRSCKDGIHRLPLLKVLYAAWQRLADYQYQRWDSFYIQTLLIQNFLWQHESSREWGLLLDSKMKFGAWILLTRINWQKKKNGVKFSLVRQDLFERPVNAKGTKIRFARNCESFFIHDYKKESTEKDLGWQGDRICWIVQKVLCYWGDTSLLYFQWD